MSAVCTQSNQEAVRLGADWSNLRAVLKLIKIYKGLKWVLVLVVVNARMPRPAGGHIFWHNPIGKWYMHLTSNNFDMHVQGRVGTYPSSNVSTKEEPPSS